MSRFLKGAIAVSVSMIFLFSLVAVPAQSSTGSQKANAGNLSVIGDLSAYRLVVNGTTPIIIVNSTNPIIINDTNPIIINNTNPIIINNTWLGKVGSGAPGAQPVSSPPQWAGLIGAVVLAALIILALLLVDRRK
jgi:hypothetical protein